jgi:endonuclease-3 related protein
MPRPRGIAFLMPTLAESFATIRSALVEHFDLAPAGIDRETPFEAIVRVILEREFGASRAASALEVLERAGLLTPEGLTRADVLAVRDALLQSLIPASPQSVAPLSNLARWVVEHHGGRVDSLFNPDRSTDWLRGELAAIRGIGLATADAILLFALKRPSYPVDRATFRVLVRHEWLDPSASYDEARDLMVSQAAQQGDVPDGEAANRLIDLARGMGQLGRRFCRAAAPRCDGCPLEAVLPEGGPREVDG